MKKILLIFLTILLFTSCSKKEEPPLNPNINPPLPSQPPSGVLIGNKELFSGQRWDTASGGYVVILKTWRLTQEKIDWGIGCGNSDFWGRR